MNQNLTKLVVILDASGSMQELKSDAMGGFNQLIEDQKKLSGDCFVTVVQFSSTGLQKTIVDNKPLVDVPLLTDSKYRISGMTALRDAIGSTIDKVGNELAALPEDQRPGKVIFAIITDGLENNSHEYSVERIKAQVSEQQERYSWQFLFTAANQDAVMTGINLGFRADLSATYKGTGVGTRMAYNGLSQAAKALRGNDLSAAVASMKNISQ